MTRGTLLAALFLTACAAQQEYVWNRPGATQQEFAMESGQCRAQAFSVPNAPLMQVAIVYNSCMQGKGWYQVPAK